MKKYYSILVLALLTAGSIQAQTQSVAFPTVGKGVATPFVTDYHSLGINVSGLGWGTGYTGKRFTMGSSEFGFGIYSDSLTSDKLKNLTKLLYSQATNKEKEPIDYQKQLEAAGDYAQAGISIFLDFNWAGFSYQDEKFGGIAFNVRENYQWYSKLNEQTTDILFRGKLSSYFDSLTVVFGTDTTTIANDPSLSSDTLDAAISGSIGIPLKLSEITNGSNIRMVWNRSYNFGYGRKLFGTDSTFALYAGIGGRFIQSMAMFDLSSDENGLVLHSSLTPAFDVDYGNVSGANVLTGSGGIPKAVGNGYGLDFGLSAMLFGKLKIAAAINNIGSVTYKSNVYSVKDTLFGNFSLNGLDQANITSSVNQMLRENGILTLRGEEKYKMTNAADFRFGASFEPMKLLRVGFDMVAPFNKENPGSLQNAIFSLGGDIRPVKWLQLSAGYYGGGIYKSNIPVGVTFILKEGAYECGIASRDALTFFTKKSNSVSTAFGFARFRF
ncbi:MAG TPA: DUF5723 family protein [Fluviicola sp.]|nr:DUF5723 family protein [Fluviicola sp.]